MKTNTNSQIYLPNNQNSNSNVVSPTLSNSEINYSKQILSTTTESQYHPTITLSKSHNFQYKNVEQNTICNGHPQLTSAIELVAEWFLSMASMSNKKLQKLCYYAYCWFIVFSNDAEVIEDNTQHNLHVLGDEKFQAWIHGPVSQLLYKRYKEFGWIDIPKKPTKPNISEELESLLQQVWDTYGIYSADELELISHNETPWKNARKGKNPGEACFNIISDSDIFEYYSRLAT